MNFLDAAYTVVIAPLVQIIEFVFVFFYKIFHNLVIPLFGVSLTVSILSLPLYMMAERWQNIERETIKRFKAKTGKIKAVFQGDDRFMILSTFYRQNHYHPVYALRNSFALFIQVPFFIAAYSYLSNLELLHGTGFIFIKDLGRPDGLISFGPLQINALPVAMTLINCIAGYIYAKGFALRDKIQIYGMAAVFLLLLYNSPSGLVLYWTLNNIFSLVKNIFYKLKNPLRIIYIAGSVIAAAFIFYLLFCMPTRVLKKRLLVACVTSVFFFLPVITYLLNNLQKSVLSRLLNNKKSMIFLMSISCLVLSFLAGLFIPSSVIASSPDEFSFIGNQASPFIYLGHSILFYLGFFFVWPVCIFFLFPDKIKTYIVPLMSVLVLLCSIYTLVTGGNYGVINNVFNFTTSGVLNVPLPVSVFSVSVLVPAVLFVFIFILKSKIQIINSLFTVLFISLAVFSVTNLLTVKKSWDTLSLRQEETSSAESLQPVFPLSKDSRNVIIIMADGAVNGFVPLIFDDNPELYDQFDGFTLFRNTASFSSHTLMGVPPIWGGYDYTPLEMNKRSSVPLVEKHNEALLTLPLLFAESGFDVTVSDPSWANYAWIPDNSIYTEYKNITAFNTMRRYTELWYEENGDATPDFTFNRIKRNIIWFSFLKINIPLLRPVIYDNGWYWNTENIGASIVDFINSFAVLDFLPELTSFESEKPSALLITNELTHAFGYLSRPGNRPSVIPYKIGETQYAENDTYHANNALYLQIGRWFGFLKENNLYDNTRIIIIADHGAWTGGLIDGAPLSIPGEMKESYNPVFLFKDFEQHGRLQFDDTFMTNADIPAVSLKGLLDNPVNPFTGNPVSMGNKEDGIFITTCHVPMAEAHGKYSFNIKKDQWMRLHGSVFDSSNWERAENE